MDLFLQTLLNGLLVGGIFATFSLGFQLTFGVLDIIDFAVGGWVMLGGYGAFWLATLFGLNAVAVFPLVFAGFFLLGYALGPLIYHVRNSRYARPALMALAMTFGLFIFMRGGALTLWGFTTRSVTTALSGEFVIVGPITVPLLRLAAFAFALGVTGALFVFLYRTRLGLAIRATAQNKEHAALMGVNVRRLSTFVYALYVGITGVAGVLVAAIYSVNPEVGIRYTLYAFFVAVLAGLGSVGGVLVAAVFLGLLGALVTVYIGANYANLAVFAMLYLVLLVSPYGILRRGL